MTSSALASLQEAYVSGLVSGCQSIREMQRQGWLPYSKSYSCQLLSTEAHPYRASLLRRLEEATAGAYLAVDGLFVGHEGECLEGLGRHYNSSYRKVQWGYRFLSSALVYPAEDAYVLRIEPLLSEMMATAAYPYRTAGQALVALLAELKTSYQLKGIVIDTEFTGHGTLLALQQENLPFLGRFRSSNKLSYQGQTIKAKDLAEQFPPGKSRYYPKLKVYAKRLEVELATLAKVNLLIVWKAQAFGWHLSTFISNLKLGVQELIRIYASRWSLEVAHRLLKQNLALASCQCFTYAAQLQHADLCTEALHQLRRQRHNNPSLSWREAQQAVVAIRKHAFLTGQNRMAA